MKAGIITIGDEILIGQIIDSNSARMGQMLNQIGVKVDEILSVSDHAPHITDALQRALSRTDIVLITGGLGPTKDDITKKTLADFWGAKLIFKDDLWQPIATFLNKRGIPALESAKVMAQIPDNCEALPNGKGLAPALWFEPDEGHKIVVSMPGVPHEMVYFMENYVLPRLKARFQLPVICHHNILTAGMAESLIAEKIAHIENQLPPHIKLAYLPSYGIVRLRLSATGLDDQILQNEVKHWANQITNTLTPKYVFGEGNITLETAIGQLLKQQKAYVALAESCTGGLIARQITEHSGASDYFKGGAVVYSNELKQQLLGVKPETLDAYGAVSEQTVVEMAQGTLKYLKADYAIAVTGIAGPDGGSTQKPVGTIWIAVANHQRTVAQCFNFARTRDINQQMAANVGLNQLRKLILNLL